MSDVYLGGPIMFVEKSLAMDWRHTARDILHNHSISVFDPMDIPHDGDSASIVKRDLLEVEEAKCLLVNASIEVPSWGTPMETFYAYRLGRAVVAFVGDAVVSPWLEYHSDVIVKTLTGAVLEINKMKRLNSWGYQR